MCLRWDIEIFVKHVSYKFDYNSQKSDCNQLLSYLYT